jgi:H+-transporting ATPase
MDLFFLPPLLLPYYNLSIMTMPKAESTNPLTGLTSSEAAERLRKFGLNTIPETKQNLLLVFLKKFWAPVPWMLEITILLELYLGKNTESIVIGALLVFNALLSFTQENRAHNALSLLRQKLTVQVTTRRDGQWQRIQAENLVPGDIIHLRMGDLIPADANLIDGQVEIDQSALTGESLPVEAGAGQVAYAGAVIKRGETTCEITDTGVKTKFGKTAELVREAETVSHLEEIIFTIVKYLIIADTILVISIILYALYAQIAWHQILPFALIILVASVPVALPATFTLATALGAANLAKQGVLVARLSAIEEAAAMTILASDKTGTITENRLKLNAIHAYPPYREEDVIRFGAQASRAATQDPLDLAILAGAHDRQIELVGERLDFTPFEPATKRSEALIAQLDGNNLRILKGAPQTIAALAGGKDINADVADFAGSGNRVLAVAAGPDSGPFQLVGLLGLQDMPRPDSKTLIEELNSLGVRVVMVTGDDALTAKAVAAQVGIIGEPCPGEKLLSIHQEGAPDCSIFAGVFPEDKFRLVQGLQKSGRIVGMTGDGVNDAPALKQAEVGIAVASATDVAKAAASMVLTKEGLSNILDAIKASRRIYQRMLTYTLNKIIKTFQIALFLSLGFILTREFMVTPLLIILLLFANDFVTMSLATDNVSYSRKPDRWKILPLMVASFGLALPVLLLSFGFFYVANYVLHLPLDQLQTLMFVMLVFTGQANVYLVRERHNFWNSRPSRWMLLGTLTDIILVGIFASQGILMTAIPLSYIGISLLVVVLYVPCADWIKILIFKLTHIE